MFRAAFAQVEHKGYKALKRHLALAGECLGGETKALDELTSGQGFPYTFISGLK